MCIFYSAEQEIGFVSQESDEREAASKWSGRCRAFVGSVVEVKVFVSTKATSAITPAIRQCLSISLLPRDSLVSVTHLLYLTDAACCVRVSIPVPWTRKLCARYLETKLVQTILNSREVVFLFLFFSSSSFLVVDIPMILSYRRQEEKKEKIFSQT